MRIKSLAWEDPLEEGMATHSSIHPGETPETEEPVGLESIGLQRVGSDLHTHTHTHTHLKTTQHCKLTIPQ